MLHVTRMGGITAVFYSCAHFTLYLILYLLLHLIIVYIHLPILQFWF
jgi:DMSO/TMAO reductase YedYZ heme-binding membrane subunit